VDEEELGLAEGHRGGRNGGSGQFDRDRRSLHLDRKGAAGRSREPPAQGGERVLPGGERGRLPERFEKEACRLSCAGGRGHARLVEDEIPSGGGAAFEDRLDDEAAGRFLDAYLA